MPGLGLLSEQNPLADRPISFERSSRIFLFVREAGICTSVKIAGAEIYLQPRMITPASAHPRLFKKTWSTAGELQEGPDNPIPDKHGHKGDV